MHISKASIEVTKLNAAERQLSNAIKMFFSEEDPVSIHTLSCAAYEILIQIGKSKGINSILQNDLDQFVDTKELENFITPQIPAGYKNKSIESKWKEFINNEYNFFKHAGKDPDKKIIFYPESSEMIITDAVNLYVRITKYSLAEFTMFYIWCIFNHKGLIINTPKLLAAAVVVGLKETSSKKDYLISLENSRKYLKTVLK